MPSSAAIGTMEFSLQTLDAESHAARLAIADHEQSDKATHNTYQRHLRSYQKWFEADQKRLVAQDPRRIAIPALPITAAKVTTFLQHETTREKVCPSLF